MDDSESAENVDHTESHENVGNRESPKGVAENEANDKMPTLVMESSVFAEFESAYKIEEKEKEFSEKEKLTKKPKRRRIGQSRSKLIGQANFSIDSIDESTSQPVAKEESPTPLNIPILMTTKGRPRKRAALIKLKRGKIRKK